MPAQDRVRCHKSRDVAKRSSADLVSEHSQPPTLIVGQSDAMAA
jgi:catechol 2,3-dioxygenase-like lactoylglutathione lyase family enzyme